jgi:hypothetical protein
MENKFAKVFMQQKRGTEAQWERSDYILRDGEFGLAKDTNILKVGNGEDLWKDLPLLTGSGGNTELQPGLRVFTHVITATDVTRKYFDFPSEMPDCMGGQAINSVLAIDTDIQSSQDYAIINDNYNKLRRVSWEGLGLELDLPMEAGFLATLWYTTVGTINGNGNGNTGGGNVDSVNGILPDANKNVKITYFKTQEEFDAIIAAGTQVRGARYVIRENSNTDFNWNDENANSSFEWNNANSSFEWGTV